MNMNNPADRLYSILERVRKSRDHFVRSVWAEALGIDKDDLHQLFYHLFLTRQLLDEVEKQIKSIPNLRHDIYLKRFDRIRRAISPTEIDAVFASSQLDEATMASLEFCAERLSLTYPETMPPDDELEALRNAIDSLKEQILSESIDHDLQIILLDLVESMRRAIHKYMFSGVEGLRQELFSILERLQKYYPIFKQHSNEPVVQEFWNILTRFDTLTSICLNVPQILGGISKLLSGG
jgi:hypothetical protein